MSTFAQPTHWYAQAEACGPSSNCKRLQLFAACLQSQREPRPEHVIVETTGMAKPLPILTSFMMYEVAQHFDLDGELPCTGLPRGDLMALTHVSTSSNLNVKQKSSGGFGQGPWHAGGQPL